jgi:RHS repeat-associated protein
VIDHYEAEVLSAQDYYPFGMLQPDRKWSLGSYRYGFNGKENDNEVKGEGNQIDFGARIYDPRIGRWMSPDPLEKEYAGASPYNFTLNSPIAFIDPDGNSVEPVRSSFALYRKKNGSLEITGAIKIKIQILNISSQANENLNLPLLREHLIRDLTSAINTKYTNNENTNLTVKNGKLDYDDQPSMKEITYKLSAQLDISIADDYSSLSKDAHVFLVVDSYSPRRSADIEGNPMINVAGLSDGKVSSMYAEDLLASKVINGNTNTAVESFRHIALHEVFHSLGLSHFWNKKPGDQGPNLMNYGTMSELDLNSEQIKRILFRNFGPMKYFFEDKKFNGFFGSDRMNAPQNVKDFLSNPNTKANYDNNKVGSSN